MMKMTNKIRKTVSLSEENEAKLQKMRGLKMLSGEDMTFAEAINKVISQYFDEHPDEIKKEHDDEEKEAAKLTDSNE